MSPRAGLREPRVPFGDDTLELPIGRRASTKTTGRRQSWDGHPAISRPNAWVWLIWTCLLVFVLSIGFRVQSLTTQLLQGAVPGMWSLPLLAVLLVQHVQFG